jgi:hypothetical protein
MAQKKITDLQLRSNVTDDLNLPSDDGIQSYRITAAQVLSYILSPARIVADMISSNAVTTAKINDLAVTTGKINDNAVTAVKIGSGAEANGRILTANGSGGASWVAVGQIAVLSDVKAAATAGGSSATSYTARVLNTIDDPDSIVTSLAGNQFTLPAGTYYIEAIPTTYGTIRSAKSRLFNVTDSTVAILGQMGSDVGTANLGGAYTHLRGIVTIASPKAFEIQTRTELAFATTGLGIGASYGDSNIFTQVTIQRLK